MATTADAVTTDAVKQLIVGRWPRLYLDSAEFNSIGRGHVDETLVAELVAAMRGHAVILVVSFEHLREIVTPGDAASRERIANTLERFWMRALVVKGPDVVEPWDADVEDIELEPWGNVADFLAVAPADPAIEQSDVVQDAMHAAATATAIAARPIPRRRHVSQLHGALIAGTVKMLFLGHRGTDVGELVDWGVAGLRESGVLDRELSAEERAWIIDQIQPMAAAVEQLTPLLESMSFDERVAATRAMNRTAATAPGAWLGVQLSAARSRNRDRTPRRSDSVDLAHAAHYPYVDIATCDAEAYAALTPHIGAARGSRQVTLFRNGQLAAVVDHIKRLPTTESYVQYLMPSQP